jgi:hypothetical protein
MNRGTIRGLIRKRLGDAGGAFWTDTELNNIINYGCNDISYRTKCLRTNGYLTSVSCVSSTASLASNEYNLSNNFTNIYSVEETYFLQDGTDWARLEPTTRGELDRETPGWRTLVGITSLNATTGVTTYNYGSNPGTPSKYYWSREENILGLYPPPDATNAGSNYIRVYYAYKHTEMTLDNDVPTIPEPLHLAIVDFGVATGQEDRGWGDKANDSWQKYFAKLNDYQVERRKERTDDDVIMVSYRNL